MREQIRDCSPRRSSLSPTRNRDENKLSMIKHNDVSSHSDKIDVVSHRVEDREQNVDRFRRDSDMYDVEIQRRVEFSIKNRREEEEERDNERYMKTFHHQEDFRKQYPKRSDPNEMVRHGIESTIPSLKHDVEPSRLGDEPKPSRVITSREYEYSPYHGRNVMLTNDKPNRLERVSRDSGESSPLSQVGSSMADFEDERSRLNLDSRCGSLVNDSDRVDERRRNDYNENLCVSQGLKTRHLDEYSVRNSARDQQEKSSRDHDSPTVSRCGKEIMDESRKNYHVGSDIAMRECPSVKLDVNNVARESDLLMQTRRSLSKSYARGRGSSIADVDAEDRHHDFCAKERMSDLSDSKQRDDDHNYRSFRKEGRKIVYMDNKCQGVRKDNQYDGVDSRKCLDLSEPYAVVVRDDKASQSITQYLNKEKEAFLDDGRISYNERIASVSDDKRWQLRNEKHFGNNGSMHSDVVRADNVVDQDGRVLPHHRVRLNKGKAAYLDNERMDVNMNYKSQQLEKDYDFRTDTWINPDDNRFGILVDRTDSRGERYYREESMNDKMEAYLQCESQQLLKDHETNSYAMMHPDVSKSDILVDQEYARDLRHRGALLNDRDEAYLQHQSQQLLNGHEINSYAMMHPDVSKSDILVDQEYARGLRYRGAPLNDRDEAYLQRESQQLLNSHETNSYVMMHPDVNKSDTIVTLVDQEDARGLRYRVVSLNDRREEAYYQYESQKLLKDHETDSYGMIHPNFTKTDIQLSQEDARALKLRRSSLEDGKESYLDNKRGDEYLRYDSQQLKKDYDYGTDERIYREVNYSDIVGHGDAKALELGRVIFSDRNEAYLDDESKHYRIQHLKDIDERMYHPSDTKSEIVVDRGGARALERRGASSNDGREAYVHYESQELLRDHEIDPYGKMYPDVNRSSAEEALRCRGYVFQAQNQVNLDDELLQLRNGDMRYRGGRQDEVYHSNDEMLFRRDAYSRRDDASEVIHEEDMAYDYTYRDVKQLGMTYEKADSKRFNKHEEAYDYKDKRGNYARDGETSTEQLRYVSDERSFGNVDHTSTPNRRVSAKERLGGRVEDKKNRVLHQVRNPKLKGKFQKKRNQKNIY